MPPSGLGKRLLGQDVDARVERDAGLFGAKRRGAGHSDDVRPRLDDLVPVRGRVREPEPVS